MKELKIRSIRKLNIKENCYDIQVQDVKRYYSNGILSHNSSIFDSITFALFGNVTKKVNIPEVVNEQTDADCKVTLEFEVGKDLYYIERYRKHKKHYDNVYLYKNGREKEHLISKSNKTDTQELIDNIIKFNYKSFVNAVMMSQESVSSFIDADQVKKKEIIENILQINIMTKYHWIAQRKRQIMGKDIETLDREISHLDNSLDNVKLSMTEYVKSCKKQKTEAGEKINKMKTQLEEIKNTNIELELSKIKQAQDLAKGIEQKHIIEQSYNDNVKNMEREFSNFETTIMEYNSFIQNNVSSKTRLDKEIKINKKNEESLIQQIDDVKSNPEKCPICKNTINEHDHFIWVQEKEEELVNIKNIINEKEKQLAEISNRTKEWEQKVSETDISKKELGDKIKTEKTKISNLIKEIKSIEIPSTMDEQELKELGNSKIELELKIKDLENKKFIDISYLESLENQAKNIEKELVSNKKTLKEKQKKYIIMEWWEQSFSSKKKSMKSWCINNIIGYFNARIKFYMDRFFDGDIQIQMDTELNETITRKDKNRTFGQFSGGQKRRLNLSILFALNSLIKANLSTKINVMFLDEILSNFLDDKGVSTVLELLEEMKDNGETAFIIEHRDSFKDYPSFEPIKVYRDSKEFSHIKVL